MGKKSADPKDHLANERTFLAWIRTGIGIMAFGFVVERFGLFMAQFTNLIKNVAPQDYNPRTSETSTFGMLLIVFGALICVFSYIRFVKTEKQIDDGNYQNSKTLPILLTVLVVATGGFLLVYLTM